jgi:HEAT repeat protein
VTAPRPLHRVIALMIVTACAAAPAVAQSQAPATDLKTTIGRTAALDFATRNMAARLVRRAPATEAVPALVSAIRDSSDQFVRYRALVLLTAFNDRGTPELMKGLLGDRNDRVREVAYRWLETHPDPSLTPTLLATLQTEQAEFVRPALIRALASLSSDPQVQRALIAEAGRGLDFFRSAVIEALGQARATWALATITALLPLPGPLQDDAIIALGRIGDPQALPAIAALPARPTEVAMAALAARCLLGDDCAARIAGLSEAVTSRLATPETVRAGIAGLGAIAATSDAALAALATLTTNAAIHDEAVVGLGGVALRNPDQVLRWLGTLPPAQRDAMIEALRDAFDRFEEDFAEEQFYAAARAAYWMAADGAPTRTLMATVIDKLGY